MLKKYLFSICLTFIFVNQACSQDIKKTLDFIIVIDDNISVGSIASLQIELMSANGREIVPASYYPGNLSLAENDYRKLFSDSVKFINLSFTYYAYIGQNQIADKYDIELKKEWLRDYFNILRIYDLNKKKYKGRYSPNGLSKNYAYEIESPSHSFRLIEKKN